MGATADSVRQAVAALYRGDPTQQSQANAWLTDFQGSPDAWEVALSLIREQEPAEVQFFAASLLVRKARAEWHRTDPQPREQLAAAFGAALQDCMGWRAASPIVLRQLCLLQAVAFVASAPAALVTTALTLLQLSPAVALELLHNVADETDRLSSRSHAAAIDALLPMSPSVYSAIAAVLEPVLGSGPPQECLAVAALRAAWSWVQLGPSRGGGAGVSPSQIFSAYPGLMQLSLAAATRSGSGEVAAAGAQFLTTLLASNVFETEEDADAAALGAIIAALLEVEPRLYVVDELCAAATAALGSAVAERWPEGAAGRLPAALPLGRFMLAALARPEPAVAEAALEYFFMINTVPLAERLPELGPPLYQAASAALLPLGAYPSDFPEAGWAEDCSGVDQEAFDRLRGDLLPDVLQEAYGLLRCAYLRWAAEELAGARTWQAAEAALRCIGAVALSARARALTTSSDPVVAEDAAATRATLAAVFSRVCGDGASLNVHPALTSTICWAVEQYAVWFGRAKEAPAPEALRSMLRALGVPGAADAAAKAFNALCLRCGARLRDPGAVAALLPAVHAALAGGALSLDQERLLVEGLAHVAAGLPSEAAEVAATQLTGPFVADLRSVVGATANNGEIPQIARRVVTRALALISAALKSFLGAALASGAGGDAGGGKAVGVLRSMEEPLGAVARSPAWQRDPEVMEAVIEVYKRAVCSARCRSLELLPAVMPAVGEVFAATALPSCLDVLAEAVEIHFQDPVVVGQLLGALGSATEVALPPLAGEGVRERGPLAAGMLSLADSFAVYAPGALWPSPLLPPLLGLAVATVGAAREADPVSKALSFLGHILSIQERAVGDPGPTVSQAALDGVAAALTAQGPALAEALLCALCDTCPRQQMRTAADRLRALLIAHPSAKDWVRAAVGSGRLPGVAEGALTPAVCAKFCELALGGNLRPARVTALLTDFGAVARREEGEDVLLAYEL